MADAILYGIVQEVLRNLGSRALNEIASTWGFKDQLEKLKFTINTVKDVLLDAEERQADSHAVRSWLERLTSVVYAADDLFDEFNTIASRRKLMSGNRVTKEVKTFFSDYNQFVFAFKIFRKINSIREELEVIFEDGKVFNLAQRALEQGSVITGRRDQTYSYVDAEEVIGRDADKNAILHLLLASDSTENEHERVVLPVLPIVGIGGMGKTTLAQLIYNDPSVQNFFELRLWVCVAEDFDIKVITEKILRSATNTESPKLDMDQLHSKLREEVGGRKYLLVLDDVWEENPNKWEELRALVKVGRKGSKIIVTTRSKKVANIMGTFPYHELQGLSEEKSWALFEKFAFMSGEAQQKPDLVKVGKEVVNKCANVPLAIKTLGGLLRREDESKWLSFKDKNLVEVMDVLKLSYEHLMSPLKNCFAYCALFPKDYVFDKEKLIELWMAEGFILPGINDGESLEDIADDYFLNLLQRGFFQDVGRNEWGDITSCKMHDFMHDLAQQEAKVRCKVANISQFDFEDNIIHLSFVDDFPIPWEIPKEMLNLKLLRTILDPYKFLFGTRMSYFTYQQVVTKFSHLRVLDVSNLHFLSLPSSIGKLIHLRYLNLSHLLIRTLPDSITNLYNLQTLNLNSCCNLESLPTNIHKLINLNNLDIENCGNLLCMPSGIGRLTLLRKLTRFVVVDKQSLRLRKKPTSIAKLSDLKKLNNLKGKLSIFVYTHFGNSMPEAMEPEMNNKHRLIELEVLFGFDKASDTNQMKHDEVVLECLRPHRELRNLEICRYRGEKLPSWAKMDNLGKTLPNLVKITLSRCRNCQQIPFLSQLCFLKSLKIHEIENVLYVESNVVYASLSSKSQRIEYPFFPSLEELSLELMKNLKGWWKEVVGTSGQQNDYQHFLSLQFLKLSKLTIIDCPNLIFLPLCPNLELLKLRRTNTKLSVLKMTPISLANTSTSLFPPIRSSLKLKRLEIDNVEDLISLSQLGLGQLSWLRLEDRKLESTEILEEVFAKLSSSLRTLKFHICESLRSISKGLEHLTALEKLVFSGCDKLVLSSDEEAAEDESEEWSCEEGEVPEWISSLSSLQTLKLDCCFNLISLPKGFQNLTSLNLLDILICPGLTERCQSPNGTDWPKIQHIPHVRVQG